LKPKTCRPPWPMPHGRSTTTSWWDEALAGCPAAAAAGRH
jgi:hypothetical protein